MKSKLIISIALAGVLAPLASVQTAFAWHPVGVITKQVQNQTAGGTLMDANDSKNAVSAKPGDVLRYVIEVRNNGEKDAKGMNDMAKVVLTDTLPQGVELVNSPSQRDIKADLGTIKPQAKVTKEYIVKVTETKDGKLIENKACFTGDSAVNDNPQKGCDTADIVTKVPRDTPETPKTPVTPVSKTTVTPDALPETGAGNVIASAIAVSVLGYIGALVVQKRKTA